VEGGIEESRRWRNVEVKGGTGKGRWRKAAGGGRIGERGDEGGWEGGVSRRKRGKSERRRWLGGGGEVLDTSLSSPLLADQDRKQ